jgi:hypothetical protein
VWTVDSLPNGETLEIMDQLAAVRENAVLRGHT